MSIVGVIFLAVVGGALGCFVAIILELLLI